MGKIWERNVKHSFISINQIKICESQMIDKLLLTKYLSKMNENFEKEIYIKFISSQTKG